MTLAHISDTHLGFRAYSRTSRGGFNQREVDVMRTFESALDAIAEREPDLVIHAGDLFHVVRPSNATIVQAYRLISRLQDRRGAKPLILVGGNHDTPKVSDSGNILNLFGTIPGVHIASRELETIELAEAEVTCVPSEALGSSSGDAFLPRTSLPNRILALHGMARQVLPDHSDFGVEQTPASEWTYVALGDYHCFKQYGPNICYAGSTDFTSTNIWEEICVPKGWVWFDTSLGKLEHVPVATRRVIDLSPIDAVGLEPDELEARIEAAAAWDASEQPIVRQRVFNVLPLTRQRLGMRLRRELGAKALVFQLVLSQSAPDADARRDAAERVLDLEEIWAQHVAEATFAASVDRAEIAAIGVQLLKEVAEAEAASTQAR
jgi:DNA repair exonuclease SbcCD nuclease subunit